MALDPRKSRSLPFCFTINVRRFSPAVWHATVDTDDNDERTFAGRTDVEAREKAEAFCRGWALDQPDTFEGYDYDYSPPVLER